LTDKTSYNKSKIQTKESKGRDIVNIDNVNHFCQVEQKITSFKRVSRVRRNICHFQCTSCNDILKFIVPDCIVERMLYN